MSTIRDVAKVAGVSTATVSRVLNNTDYVNEQTRITVLRAIKKLDYSPSYLAQKMRARKTNSFAVLIPDFTNIYYTKLLNTIERVGREEGYITVVCTTEVDYEREREYVDELIRRQLDGIIFCWYKGVQEYRSFLIKVARKVPVLIMDQPSGGLPISSVYTDGFDGIRIVIEHLIKKGHRKIGMIKPMSPYTSVDMRSDGFIAAMQEHGLRVQDEWIVESTFGVENAYEATGRLLNQSDVTAVVAVDDLMAIGALQYANDNGFAVPEDIAITGFDDIPITSYVSPKLTTVAQPIEEMAKAATKQLIRRIENRRSKNRDIVFKPMLVERDST
jgi:DNA-binding LacI/PurR family transcriptional regulator